MVPVNREINFHTFNCWFHCFTYLGYNKNKFLIWSIVWYNSKQSTFKPSSHTSHNIKCLSLNLASVLVDVRWLVTLIPSFPYSLSIPSTNWTQYDKWSIFCPIAYLNINIEFNIVHLSVHSKLALSDLFKISTSSLSVKLPVYALLYIFKIHPIIQLTNKQETKSLKGVQNIPYIFGIVYGTPT